MSVWVSLVLKDVDISAKAAITGHTRFIFLSKAITKDINRHIAVRDFLRTHPDIALEYGELKMELAYRFSEDIEGYCTGKDAFVKQLEKDALLWYQNNESYKTR